MFKQRRPTIFPVFTAVDLGLKDFINEFNILFEPYSDFNFTSLFSWSDDKAQVSILNKNLVLRMPDYISGTPVYSVLGKTMVDETLLTLLSHTDRLNFVPYETIACIKDASVFQIEEDIDNFDYIYTTEALSTLHGTHLKKIRTKINSFESDHVNKKVSSYTVSTFPEELVRELQQIDRLWVAASRREDGDIVSERKALNNLLQHADELNLLLTCILVEGQLKGFSINEIIGNSYAICHFEKALKNYHVNTGAYLTIKVAEKLHKENIRYLNWEQDLGLPGLRHSKQSYRPEKMLRKYTIKARSSSL